MQSEETAVAEAPTAELQPTKTAMQEIVSTIDAKPPVFVVDVRDGRDCQIVRFYPKCSRLLVWKDMGGEFGASKYEECLGLHVQDVEGGEEALKEAGVWDEINEEVKREIHGAVEAEQQAKVELLKKAREVHHRQRRECMSKLQLMDEQIRIRVKKAMDEKFPDRGKGKGSKEVQAYRQQIIDRVAKEVEAEFKDK